jgi:hypothetical protein
MKNEIKGGYKMLFARGNIPEAGGVARARVNATELQSVIFDLWKQGRS